MMNLNMMEISKNIPIRFSKAISYIEIDALSKHIDYQIDREHIPVSYEHKIAVLCGTIISVTISNYPCSF